MSDESHLFGRRGARRLLVVVLIGIVGEAREECLERLPVDRLGLGLSIGGFVFLVDGLGHASRADFRRELAAARGNISALAELNQVVATAAESPEPEPAPIDREAFEALLAGLTDDSGSEDY